MFTVESLEFCETENRWVLELNEVTFGHGWAVPASDTSAVTFFVRPRTQLEDSDNLPVKSGLSVGRAFGLRLRHLGSSLLTLKCATENSVFLYKNVCLFRYSCCSVRLKP